MMYGGQGERFKTFAQSAEATIKGLCANYARELCGECLCKAETFLELLTKLDRNELRRKFGAISFRPSSIEPWKFFARSTRGEKTFLIKLRSQFLIASHLLAHIPFINPFFSRASIAQGKTNNVAQE
jgi:hypothetical protein